jgi:hypothetical protein
VSAYCSRRYIDKASKKITKNTFIPSGCSSSATARLLNPKSKIESSQLLIYKCKDRGRDADHDESRDRTPDGVGLRELPNREDAKDGAGDERDRNNRERDPAHDIWADHAARLGLEFYDNIGIVSLHTAIIANGVSSPRSQVTCLNPRT